MKTNSATSIDAGAGGVDPAVGPSTRAEFKPWHFFMLAGFVAATAGVLLAGQTTPAHLVFLSLSILCAALTAAAIHRTIAPLAAPDTYENSESLGHRTRAALEREKLLVLRSIKELEFDHAMGKVSDYDFQEMAGRLKARAVELMVRLDQDAGGYRDAIEREVRQRLDSAGAGTPESTPRAGEGRPPQGFGPAKSCACGTANDTDARFCKQCGVQLA